MLRLSPWPSRTPQTPARVSASRLGVTGLKPPENQPVTSTMTWVTPLLLSQRDAPAGAEADEHEVGDRAGPDRS